MNEYRPYNAQEVKHLYDAGVSLRYEKTMAVGDIIGYHEDSPKVFIFTGWVDAKTLLKDWQHLDGSRCGVWEEKQPVYRPYLAKELFDFFLSREHVSKIRKKHRFHMLSFKTPFQGEPTVTIASIEWTAGELLKNFVREDGSPCGARREGDGY